MNLVHCTRIATKAKKSEGWRVLSAMTDISLAETKRLGNDLLTSRSHLNNAPLLLSILFSGSSANSTSGADPDSTHAQCRLEALHSLQAFFIPLLRSGKFLPKLRKKAQLVIETFAEGNNLSQGETDGEAGENATSHAEAVYVLWVWNKYQEFRKALLRIISQPANVQVLQVAAISTLMDLVREERPGEFHNSLYLTICNRMVNSKEECIEILQVLIKKYFEYSDVRYFTYSNMEKLVVKRLERKEDNEISSDDDNNEELVGVSVHTFVRNVYDVLSHLPPPGDQQKDGEVMDELWCKSCDGEDYEKTTTGKEGGKKRRRKDKSSSTLDNLRTGHDARKQKSAMTKAWMSFLQLPLPRDVYRKVLLTFHRNVIPHMTNPILLSDFLTHSYNLGGLFSVMALASLFILIIKYGLEYPNFYNKLYGLLEPSIFVAKYRSRFFELLDTCLNSPHLPGYLSAAFAKRLGRLVLSAPPSGAIVVIALIHNLLRRHPSINVLVHRPDSNEVLDDRGSVSNDTSNLEEGTQEMILERRHGVDPFVATEVDTAKCNAWNSSLWEIDTLRRHYCPAVSRFVESLETDLTVRAKTTEVAIRDFSSASYASIFEEEVGRRLKSVAMAFYPTVPSRLFPLSHDDGLFPGWKFEEPGSLDSESFRDRKVNMARDTGKLKAISDEIEEGVNEDSSEDEDSAEHVLYDDTSSDGSGGSRSRSEQSEGDDWSQPQFKRLRDA